MQLGIPADFAIPCLYLREGSNDGWFQEDTQPPAPGLSKSLKLNLHLTDLTHDDIGSTPENPIIIAQFSSIPLFRPSLYQFKLYGLDGNGDPYLPLISRETEAEQVHHLINRAQQKLSPTIISTSRGMGKTFFLKKIGLNQLAPSYESIPEIGKAQRCGRIVSFTANIETCQQYGMDHNMWIKDVLVSHLTQIFVGTRFRNVAFQQAYKSVFNADLTQEDVSFKKYIARLRTLTPEQLFEEVMDATLKAFDIKEDVPLFILCDEIQYLMQEVEILSAESMTKHTFFSRALNSIKEKRPRIIATGTNSGNLPIMHRYTDISPSFVGLTPFDLKNARLFMEKLFEHQSIDVNWSQSNLRLFNAIFILTAGIPRMIRFASVVWSRNTKLPFSAVLSRIFTDIQDYYRDAVNTFLERSTFSMRDLAIVMLCCHSYYPIPNLLADVPATNLVWQDLIDASLIFPCGFNCYCVPAVFWLNLEDNSRINALENEISSLAHGVDLRIMNLNILKWYDVEKNHLISIGHYFEKLFGMSLVIRYTLATLGSEHSVVKFSDIYHAQPRTSLYEALKAIEINLKDGFIMAPIEVQATNQSEIPSQDALYCNQIANSTAVYDCVGRISKCSINGRGCFQNKNSFKKPTGGDILKQITHLGPDDVLFWVYPGNNDTDQTDMNFRILEVKEAIQNQRVLFLSGKGCCSPAIINMLAILESI